MKVEFCGDWGEGDLIVEFSAENVTMPKEF